MLGAGRGSVYNQRTLTDGREGEWRKDGLNTARRQREGAAVTTLLMASE